MMQSSPHSQFNDATQLSRLSEQISRVAVEISRVAARQTPGTVEQAVTNPLYSPSPDFIREIIHGRRLREHFWPSDLFADPAWDIMLDLYQAELSGVRVPVSSLCIAAAVPATTALRWIKTMEKEGLIVRRPDPHDGRRVFVELSAESTEKMTKFFESNRHRTPVI